MKQRLTGERRGVVNIFWKSVAIELFCNDM